MSSELAVRPQTAALAIGSLNLNGLDDLARVAKVAVWTIVLDPHYTTRPETLAPS